jgi:predicted amidohydrolase
VTAVRFAALSLRIDPARLTSSEVFAQAVDDLVADLVPPHPTAPTLVAFPEHTGLLAAFVGPRGEAAREQLATGGPAVDVLGALAGGYPEALDHHATAHPEVTSLGQLLHLAVTDTVVRVLLEAFGGLARRRGLWVTVGAALPPWVCVAGDRATAVLGPHGGETAYVAAGPEVRNTNLVLDPRGEVVAVHGKAYLVPMERDPVEGLGLRACGLADIAVAELPFGRLGTAISKDAWMPDVNERLDQLGAQVLVQPEAFGHWGRPDEADGLEDLWPPDKFQRGGWWMLQRHPSFRVNVTPMLVGRVGDLAFDGQPFVAVPAPGGVAGLGLLGQAPGPGWAAVGGWDHLDEPPAALADPARRGEFARRAATGAGPGRPPEGAGAATAAWADVVVPDPPAPTDVPERPAGVAASVEVPGGGTHLVPDLVAEGGRAHLAWVVCDDADARGTVLSQGVVAATGDGDRWGEPVAVAPQPPRAADQLDRQWRPRLVVGPHGPVCAHLGFPAESWDLFAAGVGAGTFEGTRSGPGSGAGAGAGAGVPEGWTARIDDADRTSGVLRERGHDGPALARDGDRLVAVWSDLRWPWVLPQVRAAVSDDGGRTWSSSRRVDGGTVEPGEPDPRTGRSRAETRGQAAPAVAPVDDGVLVVWQEPAAAGGAPALWCARVGPGGASSGPRLLADPPAGAYRPAAACHGRHVFVVAEEVDDRGGSALVVHVSRDGGREFGVSVVLDPGRPPGVGQRRAVALASREGLTVVFEDDRAGDPRVLVGTVSGDGEAGPVRRLDDAPDGAAARAPTAALLGDHLVAVWQDTRAGVERLRSTRVLLSGMGDPRGPRSPAPRG